MTFISPIVGDNFGHFKTSIRVVIERKKYHNIHRYIYIDVHSRNITK